MGRASVSVCNDDVGDGTCGARSRINTTIPAGAGLHALYVDGCTVNTASGAYSVSVTRP